MHHTVDEHIGFYDFVDADVVAAEESENSDPESG